jgi:hypothetical protein
MFDCIGKGNNPGVYGVAVQFEKQSVHRSAEGLAFWRFGVLAGFSTNGVKVPKYMAESAC